MKKSFIAVCVLLFAASICFSQNANRQNSSAKQSGRQTKQSVVYFTSDVSSEGLMKVYRALNQKVSGNVGIKVSFGGPTEQVLEPELLRGLVGATGGTMFDGDGLSGNRWTADQNLEHAAKHGFTKIGKCIMVSDDDYINLPLKNGNLLKYARTGKEFADFDTLISVFRVRLHMLPAFDGNIKNISLCLANRSGKCIIHSGGTDENHYHNTPADVLEKSFADAAKAALDYKSNWAFINVLDDIAPQDGCTGAKNLGKIGIIASNDVVALEQCTLDFVIEKTSVSAETKAEWKKEHRTGMVEELEKLGGGTRNYRLVEVK